MILPKPGEDPPSVKHQLVAERDAHNQTRYEVKSAILELNLAKEEIRVLTADLQAAQLTITDLEASATTAAETFEDNKAHAEREKQGLQNTLENLANKPKVQLEQEIRDLKEEKRAVQSRLDDSEVLVRQLVEENEILSVEHEALKEEKSILTQKTEGLSREKQEVIEERNQLTADCETLTQDNIDLVGLYNQRNHEYHGEMMEAKNQLTAEYETLLQERNSLIGFYNQRDHEYHRERDRREDAEQEAIRAWGLYDREIDVRQEAEAEAARNGRLLNQEMELKRQAEAHTAKIERLYSQERQQRLQADEDATEARSHYNSCFHSTRDLLAEKDNEIWALKTYIRELIHRRPTRTRINGVGLGYLGDDMMGTRMTADRPREDNLAGPSRPRYHEVVEDNYWY